MLGERGTRDVRLLLYSWSPLNAVTINLPWSERLTADKGNTFIGDQSQRGTTEKFLIEGCRQEADEKGMRASPSPFKETRSGVRVRSSSMLIDRERFRAARRNK